MTRAIVLLFVLLAATRGAAADASAVYYRLFLTDGTALTTYGEFARVADRVVFSMPLGGSAAAPLLKLVSIPASRVDWPATEQYADAARAAHYAATRGEEEYAAASNLVAGALSDIARAADPAERMRIADAARARLADWSRASYGYRARDVAQLSSMLDEAASEARSALGGSGVEGSFDLQLVATIAPPPAVPLLGPPSDREAAEQAFAATALTDDSGERRALLEAVAESLSGRSESWAAALAGAARRELEGEAAVDREYTGLVARAVQRAAARAAAADVRGVQGVIADVLARDDRMGRRRPAEVSALLATLDARLDAARRLRLARDRWLLRAREYQAYSRQIADGVDMLGRLRSVVDDIRELAGPSRRALLRAQLRVDEAGLLFSRVTPPDDLQPVHALFVSAVQLAANACRQRLNAIATGDDRIAWSASSAAAGSLMLLDRAEKDLTRWLKPPTLP